jgi:serine/threonine protein kinase
VDALSTKKIGKYEITGILGRGGMGVVYRAEDKRIGRQVAIKTLTEGFSGQSDMLERFYREAQAGILQHPNIVIVYDLGDEDGVPFIVMEYVNGDPLDKIITSGRAVPLIDKLSIIEQVCAALGYAHQKGVVHRDIKPANVIVQPDGHAKIVDFGIARVESSNAETGLTRTGNVIGTIHYIAPERLRGLPFDGRSDIFSTGVMLYLMLTGALPFSGEDMTVLQKLVNEAHPPLGNYISNYPAYLDTIVEHALAKDPEQRYSTAEEFGADLRAVIDDLKQSRVGELFIDAERLTTEQQFTRAREVLQQLIKIDAQHTGAKQLLGIVQQNIARLQRAEQIQQLLAAADEALASSRFPEAIASLEQAAKLDPSNAELQTKLEGAKEQKRKQDEISSLLTEADASRNRGDLSGALQLLEKALHLDQNNTAVRAIYTEYSRQAKLAAQQGQIREMLQNARQEVSSRHFTAAIEILREVSKLDPSHPEAESLLHAAVTGQEQERRRKLLEQVQAQVDSCLLADDYDRATELVNRAVEQLPSEPSLLQLKTRVAGEARKFRVKQLIDMAAAKAQEALATSPHEALGIVQRALQELPGEERLLALEDSLRQRLKNLQAEEVRGRYLREAQEAIDNRQFEKAVGILESYQIEFSDSTGVSALLDFARSELAQQQRQARVASCAAQAKSLIQEDRITDAIRLLEPVASETGDASLSRLLTEARGQQAEAARRLELLASRVAKLREAGQLEEAIKLLEGAPAASAKGTLLNAMLAELRTESARKQAIAAAIGVATQALEKLDFHDGMEALQGVRRAYGDSEELHRVIADFEARRTAIANEQVVKSVEAARAALLANDAATALKELQDSAGVVEFAGAIQQTDWRRLRGEAAKPPVRRTTGTIDTEMAGTAVEEPAPRSRKVPLWAIAAAAVVAVSVIGLIVWQKRAQPPPRPPVPVEAYVQVAKAPPGAAVSIDDAAPVQTDASGQASVTVKPGPHHVLVSKDGFASFTDEISVNAGETYRDNVTLVPLPPAGKSGTLTIRGNVEDVKLFVDGTSLGMIRQGKSIPLEEGTHKIRYSAPGYQDSDEKSIKITRNQDASDRFNLVKVVQPPTAATGEASILAFSASPTSIQQGSQDQVTLQWATKDSVSTSIDPLQQSVGPNGQLSVKPSSTTIYTLTAKGKDGHAKTQQVSVTVTAAPKNPASIVLFSVTPGSIQQGDPATLQWDTKDTVTASINPEVGPVHQKGQQTVKPTAKTTYTLTAIGDDGQATTQSVTIAVTSPQPPPPVSGDSSQHPTDESALIRAAVNRYQSAYNRHDLDGIRAAWPSFSSRDEKALRGSFKDHPEMRVNIECPSSPPNISGDTAQWNCKQTTTVMSSGRLLPNSSTAGFTFSKRNGNWVISSRN